MIRRKQIDEIQKQVDLRSKSRSPEEANGKAQCVRRVRSQTVPGAGSIPCYRQRDSLKLSDDQAKTLDALQKEVDAKLDKVLTDEQKKQLKDMKEDMANGRPFGFGPPGGPPGGGPPGGPGGPPGGPGGPPGGPGGPPGFGPPAVGLPAVDLPEAVRVVVRRVPVDSAVLAEARCSGLSGTVRIFRTRGQGP